MSTPSLPASPFPRSLAIGLLLGMATLFAGNHVAARVTFDEGTGLLLAIVVRSAVAMLALAGMVLVQRKRLWLPPGTRRWQLLVGCLIAVQSLCLYSAVARIPVVVALLLMNTFPIQLALLTWVLGGRRPTARASVIMGIILIGLVVVLDLPSWFASSDGIGEGWLAGVGFGLGAAAAFSCALWVTEHRLAGVGSTLRTLLTMTTVLAVMIIAGTLGLVPGGMETPDTARGWWGLAALAMLYGIGFSTLFICVPRLDMARNAPAMNMEPVAALVLGYLILGQALSPIQLVGGAIVLGGILLLGLSRRP
ncbi:EamA family transporter [Halomonas urumqiensis]|uniref:EamA family transporter n=1 Tax=Halomonas urumqiensis TaxID=1684789 RepID=A0A2N7UDF6_9GAMM|nr:DMT family transporter [Halomonas urumqiensis]PMR78421.1 EamA family transporter [Halomonas urumqiensis]PTB03566.1 EamA/RhaT family transporter [Halomonas urumqiensis]GHE20232.1 membrane protein [Halomonas urumqiensis]